MQQIRLPQVSGFKDLRKITHKDGRLWTGLGFGGVFLWEVFIHFSTASLDLYCKPRCNVWVPSNAAPSRASGINSSFTPRWKFDGEENPAAVTNVLVWFICVLILLRRHSSCSWRRFPVSPEGFPWGAMHSRPLGGFSSWAFKQLLNRSPDSFQTFREGSHSRVKLTTFLRTK